MLSEMSEETVREMLLVDTTLLHLAAREQHFEVCKWLLSNECRVLWPDGSRLTYVMWKSDQGMDALDYALSAGMEASAGVDLGVVRFLVNHMRHKKGRYREDYVLRLRYSSAYDHRLILNSVPTLKYLIEVSREFCLRQTEPHQSLQYRYRRMKDVVFGLVKCVDLPVDLGMARALADHMNSLGLEMSARYFFHGSCRLTSMNNLQACVALLAGWLTPSWALLDTFLRERRYIGDAGTLLLIDTLAASERSIEVDVANSLLSLAMHKCCSNPMMFRRVFLLVRGFFDDDRTFRDDLLMPLVGEVRAIKDHQLTMTLVAMEMADDLSVDDASLVVTRSIPSIASAVFYSLFGCRRSMMEPKYVGYMLSVGSKALVQTVIWECDVPMSRLISCMKVYLYNGNSYWDDTERIRWIREMYMIRMLLRVRSPGQRHLPTAPTQLLTPSNAPLPRTAALNILAFGWLGNFMRFPCLESFKDLGNASL